MPRHRFTDTRDRIETAAIDLFVEKGVAETTVRDIARAVDISEGALYRHFVGKEELVWQLFERHYLAFADRLQALADSGTDGARKAGGDDSRLLPGARRRPDALPLPAVRAARPAAQALRPTRRRR